MKIYTRTGDRGTTSLAGGTRIHKSHQRLEAYGSLDELIAYIGLIKDLASADYSKELNAIQDRLMVAASNLAAEPDMESEIVLPELSKNDSRDLESLIDTMEKNLTTLTSFILPGGHTLVSYSHIARNVCRRAEREVFRIDGKVRNFDPIVIYLNRLSDYLFVLARKFSQDLGVPEQLWKPKT